MAKEPVAMHVLRINPIALIIVACCALVSNAANRVQAVELELKEVATGFNRPVAITHAPGDAGRLFVVEQHTGLIKVLKRTAGGTYVAEATPFFDVSNHDSALRGGGESGVLGMAFRPDYATSGVFFVRYNTDRAGGIKDVLLRCTTSADPDVADQAAREILIVDDTRGNHNGGWIGFGTDGYLYTAYGDGGVQRDGMDDGDDLDGHGLIGNAQATDNLLGTIVRIDVGPGFGESGQAAYGIPSDNPSLVGRDNNGNAATPRPEIIHYGLRNPWRCSFDRDSGDLWIGDVGQGASGREEISYAKDGALGLNFGWRIKVGTVCHDDSNHLPCTDPSLVDPVFELERSEARAIIGGYVYRGSDIPDLYGTYLFADYPLAKIYSLETSAGAVSAFTDRTPELGSIAVSTFGQDATGEVYCADLPNGIIYQIVSADVAATPPTITSIPLTSATEDVLYRYRVQADGTDPIQYSLDTAPAGMEIDEVTGLITWTPDTSGVYSVLVRASNGATPDATQAFSINVVALRAPDLASGSLMDNGVFYSAYEGRWSTFPQLGGLTAVAAGDSNRPRVGARTRDVDFAVHFTGFIDVPSDGIYDLALAGSYGLSPLLHWQFDDAAGAQAADQSGFGHTGAVSGAQWVSGLYGGALQFNDDSAHQVLNTSVVDDLNGASALTISMWVQSNTTNSNRGFLCGKDPDRQDGTLSMRYDSRGTLGGESNLLAFGLDTTAGSWRYESAADSQTTDWQHIVLTWNSESQPEIYINGVLDVPTFQTPGPLDGTLTGVDRLLIGRGVQDTDSRDRSWDGLIDDVRIYPFAVDAADVVSLMGNTDPKGLGTAHAVFKIGEQEAINTKSGTTASVGLMAGLHRVSVSLTQQDLDASFDVQWAVPGSGLGAIPNSAWYRYPKRFGLEDRERATAYLNMPQQITGVLPQYLSETGVFADVANLAPAPGVIPYDVNAPLWSDGADKRRWIAVPDSATITYQRNGNWTFPEGTVLVKHFAIGASARPIETRLIVITELDRYSVTYRWNDTFTDAELVASAGLTETITYDGTSSQEWSYPSRNDCATCHTEVAGGVLGVRTRQQNGVMTYAATGHTDNQLRTWNHLGLFHQDVDQDEIDEALALAPIDDVSQSLEIRARSYLDSNCMYCHQPGGPVPVAFDLRFETPLANQGIINASVSNSLGISDARVVRPRDVEKSILYQRLHLLDPAIRMPPVGSTIRDDQALEVLQDWINSMAGERQITITATSLLWEIAPPAPVENQAGNQAEFSELDSSVDHILQPVPAGGG